MMREAFKASLSISDVLEAATAVLQGVSDPDFRSGVFALVAELTMPEIDIERGQWLAELAVSGHANP